MFVPKRTGNDSAETNYSYPCLVLSIFRLSPSLWWISPLRTRPSGSCRRVLFPSLLRGCACFQSFSRESESAVARLSTTREKIYRECSCDWTGSDIRCYLPGIPETKLRQLALWRNISTVKWVQRLVRLQWVQRLVGFCMVEGINYSSPLRAGITHIST